MEGIIILIAIFFFSAGIDSNWWTAEVFGIPRNGYALLSLVGMALPLVTMRYPQIFNSLITIIIFFNSCYKVYGKLEGKGFGKALSKLGTAGLILFTLSFVSLYSPTNVMARQARFMVYIAGISQAKYMVSQISFALE